MTDTFQVVLAPDKFKGSLRASEVADTISTVLQHLSPSIEVTRHPIADGGEGSVDLALSAGFAPISVPVTGPLGVAVEATFALKDRVAVLEMASAAGLGLLPSGPNSDTAWDATTFGAGELISAALDHGATRIIVGAGGSATTDGGIGAVEALGVDVHALGQPAHQTHAVRNGLDPRLADVDLIVACDVDNPLLGPHGAAYVYGPQKGADDACVAQLELRLAGWADAVAKVTGADLRDSPGVGAAGGFAFGLVSLAGARIVSGVEILTDLTGLNQLAAGADLVVVGEGSLDHQSLRGKGPIGVARLASSRGVPVVAVAGRNQLSESEWRDAGLRAVYAITDIERDPQVCMADARRLLAELAVTLADDWLPVLTEDAGHSPSSHDGDGSHTNPVPLSPDEYREAFLSTVVRPEESD